jgi:hypothetical protein
MVVWFAHVRVGHRQLSILKSPQRLSVGGFSLCEYSIYLLSIAIATYLG